MRASEARGSVMYATAAGAVKLGAHSPEGGICKIGLRYLRSESRIRESEHNKDGGRCEYQAYNFAFFALTHG